ncbi:MAG: adenosylhomocysteinase [Rubrobacteraceae bacterium]
MNVGVVLTIEAKAAYLAVVLNEAGADVTVASPSPFMVQDDVAAALIERGVTGYATSESPPEDAEREMERLLDWTLGNGSGVLVDDRAGLAALLHTTPRNLLPNALGAPEETTTGVAKMDAMQAEGVLEIPCLAANDARCKHLFDNRYGTGQAGRRHQDDSPVIKAGWWPRESGSKRPRRSPGRLVQKRG